MASVSAISIFIFILSILLSTSAISSSTYPQVFELGNYTTVLVNARPRRQTSNSPPKPLLIATPSEGGEFPVLLLLHGYMLSNSFYSQLIQHIASHGYVVVAPQLYTFAGPDATEDITTAAAITNWLPKGLEEYLPGNVKPNLSKLGLAGHSRGGKAAFALALRSKALITEHLNFSALIGIDPVDGWEKGKQTEPPVLTYVPHSFELDMAALVIGSGLPRSLLLPSCVPEGVSHKEFYNECREPAYYFVVKDQGHMDMLDDKTRGPMGWMTYYMCNSGKSREPMRRFVGGIVVAFSNSYLKGDFSALVAITDGVVTLPVELQEVDFPTPYESYVKYEKM